MNEFYDESIMDYLEEDNTYKSRENYINYMNSQNIYENNNLFSEQDAYNIFAGYLIEQIL